ncbi:MAG: hotdog fold domain-containing protein [Acidimicrobiales bacterium]
MTVSEEEVVAAIRELGRIAHAVESAPAARGEALALIEAARELLGGGAPRRRWYELAPGDTDSTRARNRELSTFSGTLNPVAPPMTIRAGSLDDGRPALIGSVRLDRLREGPPHAVHGGVLAGLFDELLGGGQRLNGGPPGVTGRLTIRYRRPTPLDADLELRVWIHEERGRRVRVRGDCVVVGDDTGRVTADAEAIFLRVDFDQMSEMMRGRVDG